MKAFQFNYIKKSTAKRSYPQTTYGYVIAENFKEASEKLAEAKIEPTSISLLTNYKVIV